MIRPAYIGEYNGGAALTHDKIYKGNRFNDYVIIYKGLILDAWDHTRGRVQWRAGYTNDPLDENFENSMWI